MLKEVLQSTIVLQITSNVIVILCAVATGTVYIKTSRSLLLSFSIYECLFMSCLHNSGCLVWSQEH